MLCVLVAQPGFKATSPTFKSSTKFVREHLPVDVHEYSDRKLLCMNSGQAMILSIIFYTLNPIIEWSLGLKKHPFSENVLKKLVSLLQ